MCFHAVLLVCWQSYWHVSVWIPMSLSTVILACFSVDTDVSVDSHTGMFQCGYRCLCWQSYWYVSVLEAGIPMSVLTVILVCFSVGSGDTDVCVDRHAGSHYTVASGDLCPAVAKIQRWENKQIKTGDTVGFFHRTLIGDLDFHNCGEWGKCVHNRNGNCLKIWRMSLDCLQIVVS